MFTWTFDVYLCIYIFRNRNPSRNILKKISKNQEKPKKSKGLAQNKFDFFNIKSINGITLSKLKSLKKKSKKQKKKIESFQDYSYSDIDFEEPEVSEKKIFEFDLPSVEIDEEDYDYVKFD